MSRLLQLLSFILLVGCVLPARAQQTASVSGYVRDATSGETLLVANVVLDGTTQGTATNNAGYYTLPNLAPGTYVLVASYIGYQPLRQEVTLAAGQALRLDFDLRPEDFVLDEVVVSTTREDEAERTELGVSRMATQLVTQLPAVFEADVFRSLQFMPGIKAASDFSSGLYIRGGSPDQTMILLDRTTVYNPTHLFGFFSTFNPDALKDVQVYKGGFGAEYGGRLGSVIDIYNKDGNRQQMAGGMSVGLLASRAHIEGPYRHGSYMLALRRSTLEPLLAALRETEEGIPETFYFYDLNGKVNYDAGQDDKLSLAFYGGSDRLGIEPASDFRVDMAYGNRTASLNWTHLFSNRLFSNFTITGSRYFSLPEMNFAETVYERRNQLYDVSLKSDFDYILNDRHQLQAGLWAGNMVLKLKDHYDGRDVFGSRIQTVYGSLYVQDTWRPSYRWMVKPGLRVSGFKEGNYVRLEPRLSVEHRRSEALRFQAAYGRYAQYLTLITNEAFSGLDVWLTTDDGVGPAWGDQFVFGVKTAPAAGYRVDMEAYYRTMHDLFELDPNIRDVAGLDYADLFRFGKGYAYGFEVMIEKNRGALTGLLGYTYGDTRRRFPGFNLSEAGAARWYPPKYDRTHDVNLVLNYDFARRWRATATFAYGTGQAYTEPLARTEYDNPFSSNPIDNIIVGKVNASRLPAYHRLDVGVARTGRFFGMADYELQVQVINVYNRRNPWFYQYDFDYNPVKTETVRMLPLLPNISYTLSF